MTAASLSHSAGFLRQVVDVEALDSAGAAARDPGIQDADHLSTSGRKRTLRQTVVRWSLLKAHRRGTKSTPRTPQLNMNMQPHMAYRTC